MFNFLRKSKLIKEAQDFVTPTPKLNPRVILGDSLFPTPTTYDEMKDLCNLVVNTKSYTTLSNVFRKYNCLRLPDLAFKDYEAVEFELRRIITNVK